ncbi:glycosyltransferase family 2 protein [Natrialba aegyptia]|uniref:Glycosyl transferase family 2 n=1 Tax=Natrialba aegyptia DSM 13077 TaxID=1227491 RepID=M0AGA6_9EURY|nr:glycosyltransferase family 2 protein [Natrialba aegyptia]ELY97770.1 glycosyl transferase family 2 [Natrialba aegyptia DSM 13077]
MLPVTIDPLSTLLVALAIGVLAWGFDRYRRRFERNDLLIAGVLASGLLSFVFMPGAFDLVGGALDIEHRYVVISLLANIVFIGFLCYVLTLVRGAHDEVSELTRALTVERAPATDGGTDAECIFVVIPAYNEGETITNVVSSLPETIRGYEVQPLVVSDGSTDDTARNARLCGAMVVEHPINQGQGGALKTGFDIALENDATIVITMDGDGQHPADELDRLVDPIVADEADYVMGSRYLGVNRSGNGLVRRSGIRFFTTVINVLTNAKITDCTNGYRAIRGSMLEHLSLTERRFSAPELIIEARKNGLRLSEIPIRIEDRKDGQSKKPQLGFAVGLMRIILVSWLR